MHIDSYKINLRGLTEFKAPDGIVISCGLDQYEMLCVWIQHDSAGSSRDWAFATESTSSRATTLERCHAEHRAVVPIGMVMAAGAPLHVFEVCRPAKGDGLMDLAEAIRPAAAENN